MNNHFHAQDAPELCQECSTELMLAQCGLCDACRFRRDEEDAHAAQQAEDDLANGWSL